MLSLFRCVSRRTVNNLSLISRSVTVDTQTESQTESEERRHPKHSYSKPDNHFDYNDRNDSKYDSNSNSHTFSQCKYDLLTSRLLETVGWLGAAIVVGLNFETRFYIGSKSSERQLNQLELSSNFGTKSKWICGNCKYCNSLMSKLLAFAAPSIKNNNFVLDATNRGFIGNNNNDDDNNLKEKKSLNEETELKCTESNLPEVDDEISKRLETANDPIDEICEQLERASINYIEQLNNMLGVALIQTDPKEAMLCWSNCKHNSKALFNMGVAFESGKHSTDGKSDLMRAFQHYALSASMGHKLAIYNLSLFYLYGKGDVQVDLEKANALLERAAQLGVKQAKHFCDQIKLKNKSKNETQNDKLNERPIMKTSASAPNLSVMSSSFYDWLNYEKSNYQIIYNDSITNQI